MADIKRKASAVWHGTLRDGKGTISTESKAVLEKAYSFSTRFEDEPGTNPEELIAAAHAGCFTMAFSSALTKQGYDPQMLETEATCVMVPKDGGGFRIERMELSVRGQVPGIESEKFKSIAAEAEQGCPVSTVLRPGLEIKLIAELIS
jgi:osmotically inducible protein OsmC